MAWYWYLTGCITTVALFSVMVNIAIINEYVVIKVRRPSQTRMHIFYDQENA